MGKHRSEKERRLITETYTRIVDRCRRNTRPVPSARRIANQMGIPLHTLCAYLKEFNVKLEVDRTTCNTSCLGIEV